jgi:hypothetical protein
VRLAAAGGDDFAVSARSVVNDLLTRSREGVVRVDVVEVAEAEQDVVDRLVGIFRLETFEKESYAFIKHAARQLGRDSALVGACRVRRLPEADRHDTDAALQAFDEATPIAARFPQPLEAARFAAAHGLVLARLASTRPSPIGQPKRGAFFKGSAHSRISKAPIASSPASAAGPAAVGDGRAHRVRTGSRTVRRFRAVQQAGRRTVHGEPQGHRVSPG